MTAPPMRPGVRAMLAERVDQRLLSRLVQDQLAADHDLRFSHEDAVDSSGLRCYVSGVSQDEAPRPGQQHGAGWAQGG